MKQFFTLLFLPFSYYVFAQNYWQQEVNYSIDVELNDTAHLLNGFISIQYKNNSPETLNEIWMHLWPNAYKNNQTAFAKQLLENGRTDFRFSKPYQKGFIAKIDFKVNAETVKWDYDTQNIDIAKISLNQPLKPGETITISTPFLVQLPKTFSRLGHEGQSYQISQWYPKPAVFDAQGWHPMPYLDMGEFYSEYGSFDVRITLPKNYVVGATGELQTIQEQIWIDSLIEVFKKDTTLLSSRKKRKTIDEFPPSAHELKTIRFTQSKVHDFAWFADKRYRILRDTVELPKSHRKVLCTAMFPKSSLPLWKKAPDYLKDAILHYSNQVGEYPYNVVTAVEGALEAGGGMEYPTITVIGSVGNAESLDEVITHEVGHNWFYGILGSNERINPWMDEGVNSYYERIYMKAKYPNQKLFGVFGNTKLAGMLDIKRWKQADMNYLAYLVQARENRDQAATLPAYEFTSLNTGIIVYMKTALLLEYLKAHLGEATFNKAMQTYFNRWQFKHPQPSDFKNVFEEISGENLSWWFDTLLGTTKKNDVKLKSAKLLSDGTVEATLIKRLPGVPPLPTIFDGKKIVNDSAMLSFDINRKNNFYYPKRIAKHTPPLRLQFLQSIENPERTQICFAPWYGWNNYDKSEFGLAFYNPILPTQKFKYLIAPAYSIAAKTIIGGFNMSYNLFPEEGNIQHIAFGINGKRYSYLLFPESKQFNKLEPNILIEFKKKYARSPNTHFLKLRSTNIWLAYSFRQMKETVNRTQHYYVNEIAYKFERKTTLHPFDIQVQMQQSDYFMQLRAEANFRISYKQKNKGFDIRIFAGGNPVYFKPKNDISAPLGRLYLSMNTLQNNIYWLQRDYMFDETFIDRNGYDKYLGRQVTYTQGAFRSLTTFGATRNFLLSANFSSALPIPVPIYPWASTAVILNEQNKFDFAAEVGFSVGWKNLFEIHVPIATTKNIRENQEQIFGYKRFFQRISFTATFNLGKPMDWIRRIF
jgi:hypothetical protein